ncbi:SOS response-associated peptidase [Ideonella alba]|uniref:Abasic site processing protein n=1 Tax=Ideonella alba TaxID=2824118 RepID=A0A940YGF2_9BURK|nr:SOS response-associated peptidase [Ideonella alba]MBQ0932022.1 SOS response-associated peptidase [Ideonella alba]
MCGRYVVAYDPATLVQGFSLTRIQPFERRWNIAPQSEVPVVHDTREGERIGTLMRWGLVPHWAQDAGIGAKLNNARLESAAEKPSFRQALRRRRCLIPASGFYEWQPRRGADGKPFKQPWYFSAADGAPLAFAGLFEAWRPDESADWLLSCCILTREANATMAPVHDRMPVIVEPAHWAAWLDRGEQRPEALAALLPPTPPQALRSWPVDRAVGRASVDGEALTAPLAEPLPPLPPEA